MLAVGSALSLFAAQSSLEADRVLGFERPEGKVASISVKDVFGRYPDLRRAQRHLAQPGAQPRGRRALLRRPGRM